MSTPSTSSSSINLLRRHYTRILTLWPSDPLRPEKVSFRAALQRRLDSLPPSQSTFPSPQSHSSSTPPPTTNTNTTSSTPATTATSTSSTNAAQDPTASASALLSLNALYSLLDNRYARKYPLPEVYMRPRSRPDHYTELEKALAAQAASASSSGGNSGEGGLLGRVWRWFKGG